MNDCETRQSGFLLWTHRRLLLWRCHYFVCHSNDISYHCFKIALLMLLSFSSFMSEFFADWCRDSLCVI